MRRVKFSRKGQQRKFIQRVLFETNCPSLRSIIQRGIDVNYSTLKNYFTEKRLMPEDFFKDLCYLARINLDSINVEFFDKNWGKVKGGRKSRRK